MLKQTNSLLLDELVDHITENRANSIETLVGLANVRQANIVKKYLLYDEYGHSLAELRPRLHNAQAQWDDFSCQQEVDNFGRIILDESTDHA